jgi:hypothetical protein
MVGWNALHLDATALPDGSESVGDGILQAT